MTVISVMKITLIVLSAGISILSSCCPIISAFTKLDTVNTKIVDDMTKNASKAFSGIISATAKAKRKGGISTSQATELEASYKNLELPLKNLRNSMAEDFKAGRSTPSSLTEAFADVFTTAANEHIALSKSISGEEVTGSKGYLSVIWKVLKPFYKDQIQRQAGACEIKRVMQLPDYKSIG